jgi:RNA polymerase sigma-70 factor (ECF subfamily)
VSNAIESNRGDEKALINGLRNGDEDAYSKLMEQFQGRLFGIAFGITRDREESEDIIQEVFIKVFRNISSFRGDAGLSTWLHRITVNQSLNLQRSRKRRMSNAHIPLVREEGSEIPEMGSEKSSPGAAFDQGELGKVLNAELMKLKPMARAVFTLRELEGCSYDDIADILKIKKGTVNSRLFNVRKKLKEAMKGYLSGGEND